MSDAQRIAFVGGGAMAEAFARGVLAGGLAAAAHIAIGEPVAQRREHLAATLGVRVRADNRTAVDGAATVVLAVKPQVLGAVLRSLSGALPGDVLVISIVAGARIATIREGLGTPAVVRTIPNTPAQIGQGITVWTATPETDPAQRERAQALLGALGEAIEVGDEDHIDMATAISGSGPAYVFLFIEALADAGVRLGFSREVAQRLALQTVLGSAAYARETGLHPTLLRNQVTSPAGTTAEALQVLEERGWRAALARAVEAAYERARFLGGASDQ